MVVRVSVGFTVKRKGHVDSGWSITYIIPFNETTSCTESVKGSPRPPERRLASSLNSDSDLSLTVPIRYPIVALTKTSREHPPRIYLLISLYATPVIVHSSLTRNICVTV